MNNLQRGRAYTLPPAAYQKLLSEVTAAGCFSRTYRAYTFNLVFAFVGLLFSAYLITATNTIMLLIISACFAAFFSVQLGLLGHDLSHNAVFHSRKSNQLFALLLWGLGCGLSEGRWFSKHNAHHQAPNQIGHDPDLEIPFVFSSEQAASRSTFSKQYLFPNQHYLFWIGLWFVYPYNIFNSMRYMFHDLSWRSLTEITLLIIHFVITIGFTFWFLPPVTALFFNLLVFILIGLYMGILFAPNHKGEDMLLPTQQHNWVHQITLTRNLTPSPLVSYVFGGLEYQIEHHLFPTMSHFHYRTAQPLVQRFCVKNNIPYKEATCWSSFHEIHTSLRTEAHHWR